MARRTVVDHARLRKKLTGPQGPVYRDLYRRGQRVVTAAKRECPVDRGRLRASIGMQIIIVRGVPVARIGTNVSYAKFVHNGTGIYGPKRRRITPVRAKVLRFKPKGSRAFIYRASVAGQRPNPFLVRGLRAAA